jgi:hypothetical protein
MSVVAVLDSAGRVAEHTFQIGGSDEQSVALPEPVAAPPPKPAGASRPAATVESDVLTTRQLLSKLKARLRVVEREIKARKSLEIERGQIKRLIDAALTERDNVRRIRSAG